MESTRHTHGNHKRHRVVHSRRRAITLIELLVVISILSMLMAMLLPAINSAREAARANGCQNNLRQFGMGISTYAGTHRTLCSGAFDWRRDGCVTEVGWVADLQQIGHSARRMLCPSNPAQISETYNDLLNFDPATDTASTGWGAPPGPRRRDHHDQSLPGDRGPAAGKRGPARDRRAADLRPELQHELHGELVPGLAPAWLLDPAAISAARRPGARRPWTRSVRRSGRSPRPRPTPPRSLAASSRSWAAGPRRGS